MPDHDNATWRDLADQLNPTQIDKLTDMESRHTDLDAAELASGLLDPARGWAAANTAAAVVFDDLPLPPDAHRVRIECVGDDEWVRTFDGTERTVDTLFTDSSEKSGTVGIVITGRQDADGRTARKVMIEVVGEYDADTARRIAAALTEAADEIEASGSQSA